MLNKEPRYPKLCGKEEQLGCMWNYEVSFMALILKNQEKNTMYQLACLDVWVDIKLKNW